MSATRVLWRRAASSSSSLPAAFPRPSPPSSRSLLFRPRPRPRQQQPRQLRFQSTEPPPSPPPPKRPTPSSSSSSSADAKSLSRLDRILARALRFLPRFLSARLRPALSGLRAAPASHVAAFLVLHEATAVAPLFGLAYAFHALDWAPTSFVLGPWAAWAEEGLRRNAARFRRRGWLGMGEKGENGAAGKEGEKQGKKNDDDDVEEGERRLEAQLGEEARREREREGRDGGGLRGWAARFRRKDGGDAAEPGASEGASLEPAVAAAPQATKDKKVTAAVWQKVKKAATLDNTDKGYKIGIQIAAAYTITKLLLVPRVALSLWLTPWLARGFVRARHSATNFVSRKKRT
ncbi:hypothetical protein GGR56DRAFT_677634 [Xylariaceae sp. FL0804]|nr:hypothetical protein GGR56DRAFT_677634 [Xylariaceae sp. FL0804]